MFSSCYFQNIVQTPFVVPICPKNCLIVYILIPGRRAFFVYFIFNLTILIALWSEDVISTNSMLRDLWRFSLWSKIVNLYKCAITLLFVIIGELMPIKWERKMRHTEWKGMSLLSDVIIVKLKNPKRKKVKVKVAQSNKTLYDSIHLKYVYVCVSVLCLVSQLCPTLYDPMDAGSSVHGDSPGKNTGVGSQSLLQGIFPTQESKRGLLHYRWILYQQSY